MRFVKAIRPYLWVADINESLAFYRDGLGFGVADQVEWEGAVTWMALMNGPVEIMLSTYAGRTLAPEGEHGDDDEQVGRPELAHCYTDGSGHRNYPHATWLYVDDADAAHQHLLAAGYPPVEKL